MALTLLDSSAKVATSFSTRISACLKDLLESKHLYQSIYIEFKDELDKILNDTYDKVRDQVWNSFHEMSANQWYVIPLTNSGANVGFSVKPTSSHFSFRVPDVKLYCTRCGRIEPFNLISSEDFFSKSSVRYHDRIDTIQVFIFSFLCQSCKLIPEVFLVRREGWKLILSGRSPIEHVSVPKVISKKVENFYSSAIVAHQSGQTLAGLFLLRTLIEQWARYISKSGDTKADEVIDAYMNILPLDFKSRFPSIKILYGELSTDIHTAKGSAELFDKAIDQVVEHFDAIRLFKIPTEST
jgi:hypothetical protein